MSSSTFQSMFSDFLVSPKLQRFLFEHDPRDKPGLCVITGPTASGKTALSLHFAKIYDGEIISADSAQVYRFLDISTEKIDKKTREAIPHHLIDIRNPNENFSLGDFKKAADAAIEDILKRGKLPIVCGGTGLYIRALTENYALPELSPDPELRANLEAELEAKGLQFMYERLQILDKAKAEEIGNSNPRKILRALEICILLGPNTSIKNENAKYEFFKIAIDWPRETLYERINSRVDEQMKKGLLDEVKSLLEMGYSEKDQGMISIGIKEFLPYFKGEASLEDCVLKLKQSTRNFAKRQLTWFRKEPNLHWMSGEEFMDVLQCAHAKGFEKFNGNSETLES